MYISIYYQNDRYKLSKSYPSDSCYDINARVPEGKTQITPGKRSKIYTGIKISLPPGWEAIIRPRSGIALRHGVTVLNSPGTIDQNYTGELAILLINHGDKDFIIKDGDRIAQISFNKIPKYKVEQLLIINQQNLTIKTNNNTRGFNGFGTTGIDNLLNKLEKEILTQ